MFLFFLSLSQVEYSILKKPKDGPGIFTLDKALMKKVINQPQLADSLPIVNKFLKYFLTNQKFFLRKILYMFGAQIVIIRKVYAKHAIIMLVVNIATLIIVIENAVNKIGKITLIGVRLRE